MTPRGDSLGRTAAVLLLALVPLWGACSSSSGSAKTSEPAAPAAEPAPTETASTSGAAAPESQPPSEPASIEPLPGTPRYSADRIREIEGSLKPLKPIPTPVRSTDPKSQKKTDTGSKIASPKLTLAR